VIAHPPHDLVRAVRSELATPGRYELHPATTASPSWLELAVRFVGDAFDRFERAIASHLHLTPVQTSVVGDGVVLVCAAVVALVAARLLMSLQLEGGRYQAQPLGSSRSAQALARAAHEAALAGNYVHAIRLIFAAAVVLLDLRGIVADDESWTINELKRALRERASGAEPPFSEIARAYTAAAYAESAVDAAAWKRAEDAYARLVETAS
jgi:hypothetical protein